MGGGRSGKRVRAVAALAGRNPVHLANVDALVLMASTAPLGLVEGDTKVALFARRHARRAIGLDEGLHVARHKGLVIFAFLLLLRVGGADRMFLHPAGDVRGRVVGRVARAAGSGSHDAGREQEEADHLAYRKRTREGAWKGEGG